MLQQIKGSLLCFCLLLILPAYSEAPSKTIPFSSEKPLVLQWEVSHPRNTDQISLIFKKTVVELITNTSSYQKGREVKLGRFQSPLNTDLKMIRARLKRHYMSLKQTVPMLSLIKTSRILQPRPTPHAPLLRINEEKLQNGTPDFKSLASVIYQVWENEWICVECATYKKRGKFIIRTMKRLKTTSASSKGKSKWSSKKQKLSRKLLNCVPKGKKKVECIDPLFGIFEI